MSVPVSREMLQRIEARAERTGVSRSAFPGQLSKIRPRRRGSGEEGVLRQGPGYGSRRDGGFLIHKERRYYTPHMQSNKNRLYMLQGV